MAMASSLPILRFYRNRDRQSFGNRKRETPVSWWLTILTLGPLLGSFITGPAAMTICALLLRHHFYSLKPSQLLKYATLGLLFVNISVGGGTNPVLRLLRLWSSRTFGTGTWCTC